MPPNTINQRFFHHLRFSVVFMAKNLILPWSAAFLFTHHWYLLPRIYTACIVHNRGWIWVVSFAEWLPEEWSMALKLILIILSHIILWISGSPRSVVFKTKIVFLHKVINIPVFRGTYKTSGLNRPSTHFTLWKYAARPLPLMVFCYLLSGLASAVIWGWGRWLNTAWDNRSGSPTDVGKTYCSAEWIRCRYSSDAPVRGSWNLHTTMKYSKSLI